MVMARFIAGRIAGAVLKKAPSGGGRIQRQGQGTRGGEKIKAILDQAEKSRCKKIEVGFFRSSQVSGRDAKSRRSAAIQRIWP